MADQEDTGASLAPFPQPPAYLWTQFTEDNVAKMANLRAKYEAASGQTLTAASVLPADAPVPDQLIVLQPPPPPETGRWRVFGQLYSMGDQLPTLEEQGVPRLGAAIPLAAAEKDAHASKVFELKKLSKSLLLNFLELIGVLSTNPHDAADKLADLQTIFFNMHQHINEWRPHQTREALISMLQAQLERTRNETRALHEVTDSVRRTLVGLADGSEGTDAKETKEYEENTARTAAGLIGAQDAEKQRQREIWASMDEMFR
ncbi:mediator of rna polymerase ii transcription subunit 7 [Ophiostoma piceae UAMH 11346]|uniref:Mediator of RNA polymerase II transcription subunit 7 n=1 Tax=Ophiostoma piceae (strain UAMH 11346) TaxID=1262450 RepID=S3BP39_OPHP1|nr:mediator of rna polymerase ii transcription subunit 7 [Ophiostoma piceae UAMH 11346]